VPSYLRGLIRPEPGKALAYLDWEQQEFAIGAALSGDVVMQDAYRSGDPYLSFAIHAGAVPPDATKQSHPREREQFKVTVLGTQYLIGAHGLGFRLGVTLQEAEDLLDHHRRIYHRFWQWCDSVSDYSQLYGQLTATLGWKIQLSPTTNLRTMRNFPMQANGSEMLRLASIYALAAGVSIVTLVHDAVLIEADQAAIEHHTALTQQAMEKASRVVLAGFPLRTEARIIRAPDRLIEERGTEMWRWMVGSLTDLGVDCAA
jgi:DNA polymerase I-like protein with 3'-5' exonuclease and polymerase domains